jgi:hypothetical protein
MEMRIVLSRVLQRATLRPAGPELEKVQFRGITLAPREGVRVVLERAPTAIDAVASAQPTLTGVEKVSTLRS